MKNIKWLFLTVLILLLSACSTVATQPSVELPYTIVNEDKIVSAEYLDDDVDVEKEYLEDKQILNSTSIRNLTIDEANSFAKQKDSVTTNVLMDQYKVVEFNFGNVISLSNYKSFTKFPSTHTNFVFDETIVPEFNQILAYTNKELLLGTKLNSLTGEDEDVAYASTYEDMKIIVLVRNEYAQEGLQLRTRLNNEEIYIDIQSY